jgi:hypothetical protein
MRFDEKLAIGQAGESAIARWLIGRGCTVLPAYEIEISRGKGPRVYSSEGPLVSPDLGVIKDGAFSWVEAKHKTVFSWRRCAPGPRWETGVDLIHWTDYCRVEEVSGCPVWLLFLHRESQPWSGDAPYLPDGATCPTGLFGISLSDARKCARTDSRHAHGMAYWGHDDLTRLAPLAELAGAPTRRPS